MDRGAPGGGSGDRVSLRVGYDATPLLPPRTGVGQYTYRLLQALTDRHPEAEYLLYTNRDAELLSAPFRSTQVIQSGFGASRWLWLHVALPQLSSAAQPALFHFPNAEAPLSLSVPYVLTLHDLSLFRHPSFHPRSRLLTMRLWLPLAARRAAAIICVSRFTQREARRVLGLANDRLHFIPSAAGPAFRPVTDPAVRRRVAETYALPERFLLFVGTLEPRKNLGRLLRACAYLSTRGIAIPLVVAGPKGWGMRAVQRRFEQAVRRRQLHWLGFVAQDDLPAIYSLATALVFPSLYEGFGLPVLEAMACGTAVVMSDRPAHAEIAGGAALTFDPEDVGDMADAIAQLVSSPTKLDELRQRGQARAAEFSWDHTADQTFRLYQKVLASAIQH
jgi:alpha-1,3-rhamnosyl/mannosyltransferase